MKVALVVQRYGPEVHGGAETLALWRAGLERVRRAGGLAVLVTHPEPHFSGGSAELAQAYATFVAEVCWDEEAWIATAGAIARWWVERRASK